MIRILAAMASGFTVGLLIAVVTSRATAQPKPVPALIGTIATGDAND